MGSLLRTFWTIRYLRPRQIVDRITRRLVRPRIDPRPAPPRRIPILGRPSFLAKVPSFLGDHRFLFLNEIRRVDPGDFAVSKPGLLWDYNFHYFDSLLAPCPCDEEKREWVLNWIRSVPAGSRPGWDPYPTSRRISNWIKWALASSLDPPPEFLHSLAAQARYLQQQLEYHLMGNHLLANATALTLAGTFFGGEEGDRWFRRGTRLLHQELLGQFCADGAHHELSTTYHSVVLEDLLDLVSVARTMGVNLPDLVARTAAAAARWVHLMTRPDGNLPLFNDASYGASADPQDLREYAEALGLHQLVPIPPGLALMEGSGYFRYARGRLFVIGDVGELGPDYQPGHAHCDMLSFELCWDQRPILVDTGTSTYELGERRILERSTASHNTVQVGDMEQSEIWAAFRVAR